MILNPEELKTLCRSMITCSHYNNLNDKAFEEYIKEIIDLANKPVKSPDIMTGGEGRDGIITT
jgi:hypothetical protein